MRMFLAGGGSQPALCLRDPPLFRALGWHGEADLETNRTAVIEGLLASIGEEHCHFGVKISGVRKTDTGAAELLGEGDQVLGEFDVIVDATGTHSPFRKYRFTETSKPQYTGVTWVQGVVDSPERDLSPELVRRLGEGTMAMFGPTYDGAGTTNFALQRFGADPEDKRCICLIGSSLKSIDAKSDPTAVARALELPKGSHGLITDPALLAKVRELFRTELAHEAWPDDHRGVADKLSGFRVLPMFMTPSAAETAALPEDGLPLLCIGDALHALPPWSGTSGNFALRDASDTATALLELAKGGGEVVKTLRRLEGEFLKRADGVGKGGAEIRRRCQRIAEQMTDVMPNLSFSEFDVTTLVTSGAEDFVTRKKTQGMVHAMTWLNSWDNYRMSSAGGA
jgi:2-polyprenyl-6-methoxyphenol hydroxylase-like FAD-dependent oxidoreductase